MPYHHMAVNLSDSVPLEDGVYCSWLKLLSHRLSLQALYTNWKENPGDSVIKAGEPMN